MYRLQTRVEWTRQGVLTVGIEASGGVLDALQRLIDLEHVGDMLCPVITKLIILDAANENRMTGVNGC